MITVIIDPGHGGNDPGAFHGDYREKDQTLGIAKRQTVFGKRYLGCGNHLQVICNLFGKALKPYSTATGKGSGNQLKQ